MIKKVLILFATLAVAVASAATYRVKLITPSVVNGTALKAGEYKVEVLDNKAVFTAGKQTAEAKVKVETADQKFGTTSSKYNQSPDGTMKLQEMKIGGSNTKLVFLD